MSRNGSGTYSLPTGNPVVTNTVISSTWANSTLTDIASALTGSVAADGQTPMTGPLNLNSNKITNLTAGTVSGDAVEYSQLVASSAVANITSGTINGAVIGGSNPVAITGTTITGTSFNTANFHISESGGKLIFKYGTTTIASLDSTGVFTTLSSVVGAGTP
jgi:hypothetical protein